MKIFRGANHLIYLEFSRIAYPYLSQTVARPTVLHLIFTFTEIDQSFLCLRSTPTQLVSGYTSIYSLSSTMAQKTPTVILESQNDWDEWFETIKSNAIVDGIWAYVDPDTPKLILPSLKEPIAPKPTDINPQKTTFSSLEKDEKE